ncbi:MAG: hypothetical protein LIO54_04060, partial [Oscillospiraceae bacterium]|nr:hypothetical protein [Oscillospiraceae bacterium]
INAFNNPYIGNSIITGEFLPAPVGRNVQGWAGFAPAGAIYFPCARKVSKGAPEGKPLRRCRERAAVTPSPVVPLFPIAIFKITGNNLTLGTILRSSTLLVPRFAAPNGIPFVCSLSMRPL